MKNSKIKKIMIIKNKIFLYLLHDDIYLKINIVTRNKKVKLYKIQKMYFLKKLVLIVRKIKNMIKHALDGRDYF